MNYFKTLNSLCKMIKIEHSIFALPFAWFGLITAARGWVDLKLFIIFSLAMVCGRSFAMTLNRIADLQYDSKNPRTAARPLVTGEISKTQANIFCLSTGALLLLFSAMLNQACFVLGIIVLLLSVLYSYAKRFTWLCHLILGAVLGLSPLAGWLAFGNEISISPILIGLGIMFWVAGFDVLYACQDIDFDREQKLYSIPVKFGLKEALNLAAAFHANTLIFLLLGGWQLGFGLIWYLIMGLVCILFIWQHNIVSATDLSRVNDAFFNLNALISPLILVGAIFSL